MAVGMTEGGLAVITSANAWKRRTNRQSSFGPTCRLVSSHEVGSRVTVGTLEQGYPLIFLWTLTLLLVHRFLQSQVLPLE
jgi:hypothetical protein